MLVAQFPKETENDYSKINLVDTPSHKVGGALCKYNQGLLSKEPLLRVKSPGLRHPGAGSERGRERDERCQAAARGKQGTERRGGLKARCEKWDSAAGSGVGFAKGQGTVGGARGSTGWAGLIYMTFIPGRGPSASLPAPSPKKSLPSPGAVSKGRKSMALEIS